MLRFVHLSDIHFSHRPPGSPFELDKKLRRTAEQDLDRVAEWVGGVSGIIVSGDIAFSGLADEFSNADTWLRDLCVRLGIPPEDVWLVPGNHDVDWRRLTDGHLELRRALRECNVADLDRELEAALSGVVTGPLLLDGLERYRSFAEGFGCNFENDRPFWDARLQLGCGYELSIRGANSALVSNQDDHEETGLLVLGEMQTQLPREEGVLSMTVCHHPAAWIRDGQRLQEIFDADALVQLTGHDHSFRCDCNGRRVRVEAGAMHPERHKSGWEPRFNVITLAVRDEDPTPLLDVQVYPRVWHRPTQDFVTDSELGNERCHIYHLPIPRMTARPRREDAPTPLNDPAQQYVATSSVRTPGTESIANRERRLTWRISLLTSGGRRQLLAVLGMDLAELSGTDPQAFPRELVSLLKSQDRLAELWDRVEEAHGRPEQGPSNPYRED